MPDYTIPSATSQGFQFGDSPYPPLRGSASGWAAQGSRPSQANPFDLSSLLSGYGGYGVPSGGFGGYSPQGAYSPFMSPQMPQFSGNPFQSYSQTPFGPSTGSYSPQMPTQGYMPQMPSGATQQGFRGYPQSQGQMDPTSRFLGSGAPQGVPQGAGAATQGGADLPVPSGGVYGAQKWSTPMGSNAVDIFVRRGTPVTAPVSGTLVPGQNGQLILMGDGGLSFAFRHGVTTASGRVQKGQQIGYVNDPGMDSLGQPGFGNMPDGYQHLELSVSNGNYFPSTPGGGGSIDASQWLESQGYRGTKMAKTPGPPDARGGGGLGGFGSGSMFGGQGGAGGFPGAGMSMPGMPGQGGNPFGMGMPGMNPFMGMGMGGPQMGMNPFMSLFGGR